MYDDWTRIEQIEGFFAKTNYIVWEFFFRLQKRHGITGNLFEIGTWYGRSAAALTLHCDVEQTLVLCDPMLDKLSVKKTLGNLGFDTKAIVIIPQASNSLAHTNLESLAQTVRWFHIDGDHSAQQTYFDFALANKMISEHGIICLDDFLNPRYVSVTFAAFSYLRNHPHSLRLVLAGDNKGYFCRPKALSFYYNTIISELPNSIGGSGLALHQSQPFSDCETLGLQRPWIEGATFIGLDDAQDSYEIIERKKFDVDKRC